MNTVANTQPRARPAGRRRILGLSLCQALLLLSGGCGEGVSAPPCPGVAEHRDIQATLSDAQRGAACEAGVPPVFVNAFRMVFVFIPPGSYERFIPPRGASPGSPRQRITLTRGFYAQRTEVTNEQFRIFRPGHDSGTAGGHNLNRDLQPVTQIGVQDAEDFVAWLNQVDGARTYRLPTSAEWEWMCLGGERKLSDVYYDPEMLGRYANVSDRLDALAPGLPADMPEVLDGYPATAPVASYLPNAWGLYDMIGNVKELCQDWQGEQPQGDLVDPQGPSFEGASLFRGREKERMKVAHGGSWVSYMWGCFVSGFTVVDSERDSETGFRLVLSIAQ